MQAELRHDAALDGLRAVAVGLVVLTHAFPSVLPGGWVGVDVFFVLSGFLITTILRREIEINGAIDYRAFYIRRSLRLVPALLLFLACGLAIAVLRGGDSFHKAAVAAVFAVSYTMNWNLAFAWYPGWLFTHTWSLAIEEQFYLLWPILFVFLRLRNPVGWLIAALVIAITWRSGLTFGGATPMRTYAGFDTRADGLLIGCLLGLCSIPAWIARFLPALALAAGIAFALIVATMPFDARVTAVVGIPLGSTVSAVFLLYARRDGWFRTLLSGPGFAYVGRISYGIYLWHPLTLTIGEAIAPGWGGVAGALMSVPIAAASFELWERPFLRLKSRFAPG
jgi:peptidoglycan/LPS O-acetylase OafA/YrhL